MKTVLKSSRSISKSCSLFMLYFCLCVFSLFSSVASAGGWTPYSEILNIQVGSSTVYVRLDPNVVSNINSCSNWGGWFAIYDGTYSMDDFDKTRTSVALAAQMAEKTISIYSGDCTSNGYNTFHNIQTK